MAWAVHTLNHTVNQELEALPEDMRARFVRIAELIEGAGLPNIGEPHVKHIQGSLWQMRLKAAQELRALCRSLSKVSVLWPFECL